METLPELMSGDPQAALQQRGQQHTGRRAELAARPGISERSLYCKLTPLKPG